MGRDRGSTMVKVLRYKSEGCWFDPRWCHGIFHWHKSFWSHYGPGVDSASNRNENQEFPGGKCGRCIRLTALPPSCAVVKKSGNLNFLEPSWPLQACNGTALPNFFLFLFIFSCWWFHPACSVHRHITWKWSSWLELVVKYTKSLKKLKSFVVVDGSSLYTLVSYSVQPFGARGQL
jgi:hypothetical protein